MIGFLVSISKWLGSLHKTIISFLRIIVLSKSPKSFLKQKTNSSRITILGNGPSFKKTIDENKDFFKSSELICLNHFAITEYYTELKPKYYFAIAHDLFLDEAAPHYVEASKKLFNTIVEKTTWKIKFFITYEAKSQKRWQEILRKNENVEIVFMNITPVEGFKFFQYSWYSKGKGMARPHNVMIPSMFFAISSGVKEIILVGAEHSWLHELHVDDDNNALFFNKHFYDEKSNSQKYNFKGTSYLRLHEILRSLSNAFEAYHILEEYSSSKSVKIVNCSPNSFIDAFEKKKISDLD